MNRILKLLILVCCIAPVTTVTGQQPCGSRTEKIVGPKGSNYTVPCADMVILDLATYSKYRYMEKQFHIMDSVVSGYTSRIDSMDKESLKNRALLEEKIKDKEHVIERYKNHTVEVTAVLENVRTTPKAS